MTTREDIETVIRRLTRAELDGDVGALDRLTTGDFTLVGPLGFLLHKDEWLDRYRSGALSTESLTWQPDSVRRHDDTAIAIGTQVQRARYQGHPVDAQLRATHVLLRLDADWRVAGMHLSPIGEPPAFARPPQTAPTARDAPAP
jgi:ketosteroid isomerase-like protein